MDDDRDEEQEHCNGRHHQEAAETPYLLGRRSFRRNLGDPIEAQSQEESRDADKSEQKYENNRPYWHARHSS